MTHEIANSWTQRSASIFVLNPHTKVNRLRDNKAKKVTTEFKISLNIINVETEMLVTSNFKWVIK